MIAALLAFVLFAAEAVSAETAGGIGAVGGGGAVGSLVVAYMILDRMGLLPKRKKEGEEEKPDAAIQPNTEVRDTAFYKKKISEEQRQEEQDALFERLGKIDFETMAEQLDELHQDRFGGEEGGG